MEGGERPGRSVIAAGSPILSLSLSLPRAGTEFRNVLIDIREGEGGPKCLAPVILQDESFKSGEINNNFDRIGAAFDRSRSNFARFEERAQLSASHRLRSDESRDDNDGRIASTRVLLVLHVSTFLS